MRDPWHPALTFWDTIEPWQSLMGAMVALCAAGIAVWNTTRSLRNAEKLELQRRLQKKVSLRAVLPLALSEISGYAITNGETLSGLYNACVNGVLVHAGLSVPTFGGVPSDVIAAFANFIEYSDNLDVQLLVRLLRRIQVHQARTRSLADNIRRQHGSTGAYQIQLLMIDCAAIYAGAAVAFDYARGEEEVLPKDIIWKNVRSGLNNMGLWKAQMPSVHQIIDRLEVKSEGPKF
jgi:hypothetical protein